MTSKGGEVSFWRNFSFLLLFVVTVQYYFLFFRTSCKFENSHDFITDWDGEQTEIHSDTISVALLTALSVLSSGLGALPFFFFRSISQRWICCFNSIAAGMMLSASLSLSLEALMESFNHTIAGITCGILFVIISDYFLSQSEDLTVASLQGKEAKKVLLFIGVMSVHSLAEGIGMGMSFGGGSSLGFFVNIAMAVHNIPEGTAVALVLVSKKVSPQTAMMWATLSAVPQPLMAIPAFWFVEMFRAVLPFGLSFSSGAMVWMVFTEMIPEAFEAFPSSPFIFFVSLASFILMELFQRALGTLL